MSAAVKSFLFNGWKWSAPREYVNYVLMTKLWHCTPSEFDRQDMFMINLHAAFYSEENTHERKEQKRAEQKRQLEK